MSEPYYRPDLARVHHLGFGSHADACAPGVLALLEPVRERNGTVLELGCGSGLLTRHLTDAGHHVIATDGSQAMLDLARRHAPAADVRPLLLPDDPLPECDAVVSVGHVLSYLSDEAAVCKGLEAAARALRPGGVLAVDLADLEWAAARTDLQPYVRVEDDWAIITRYEIPTPERYVRHITTFLSDGGTWRRDDERHDNVLIDVVATVPAWLAEAGVDAEVRPAFGTEDLPAGLVAVVGKRRETRR